MDNETFQIWMSLIRSQDRIAEALESIALSLETKNQNDSSDEES
mgnify:CR=1 FL=1